jgi:hypothetical protein
VYDSLHDRAGVFDLAWHRTDLVAKHASVLALPFGLRSLNFTRGLGALLLVGACALSGQTSFGLVATEWVLAVCAAISLAGVWLPLWQRAYAASVSLSAVGLAALMLCR